MQALGYRSGLDDRPALSPVMFGLQLVTGFIASSALVALSALGVVIAGNTWGGLLALGGIIAALAVINYRARRSAKAAGWVVGVWLGIGIVGLIEGICFANFA